MKKNVSFQKEIVFPTNIAEITSISLEHTPPRMENSIISGDFVITGEYKMTDSSTNTEPFHYEIPFDIELGNQYLLNQVQFDISDFYYEIKNENTFVAWIEICIDKIEEKPMIEQVREEQKVELPKEEPSIQEDTLLEDLKEEKGYSTYHIYIVREGDNLENILINYHVTKEDLEPYNDLKELKIGDKLIIPEKYEQEK